MGQKSNIEWTNATWNPTTGCDRVSPGCAKCYAKTEHDRRHKGFLNGWTAAPAQYHQPFEVVQVHEGRLDAPLRWREPRMVFVNSVSDLFYGDESDRQRCERQGIPFHPIPDDFIDRVFAVMALAPRHTFQVLTKRAERMRAYMAALDKDWEERLEVAIGSFLDGEWIHEDGKHLRSVFEDGISALLGVEFSEDGEEIQSDREIQWPLPNVWLGVSVENRHWKSRVIPELVSTPAAVRFVSVEPLLEDLGDISDWFPREREVSQTQSVWIDGVNWVIVGGESGHDARPFDIAWARSIVAQCKTAGVPVFVKQLGVNPIGNWEIVANPPYPKGRLWYLKSKKGGDPSEWPPDLNVRQFPAERSVSRGTSQG